MGNSKKNITFYDMSGNVISEILLQDDFNLTEYVDSERKNLNINDLDVLRALKDINLALDKNYRSFMFVDDNVDLIETLVDQAQMDGHYAEGYADPDTAYERFVGEHNRFGIILVDFAMPGIDGARFIKVIKDKNRSALIFLLTGQVDIDTGLILDLPVIHKPTNLDNIIKYIEIHEY